MKIKIKKNTVFEVRTSEIDSLQKLVNKNPTQFANIFGDKQRLVIDSGQLERQEDVIEAIDNTVEKIYSKYLLEEFIKFVDKLSINEEDNRYIYGVNLQSSSIVRIYDKIIPTGPKKGEKIQKVEKIKLRDIQNILVKCIKAIRGQEEYPNFTEEIKKIFPVVNPDMEKYLSDSEAFVLYIVNKSMPEIDKKLGGYKNPAKDSLAYKIKKKSRKPMDALANSLSLIGELSGDNVIIISRARIDLARMSDFPGIESCHSPPRPKKNKKGEIIRKRPFGRPDQPKEKQIQGKWFSCAIQEAKDGGAVAFLMPRKSVEKYKDKLQEDEFYRDVERDIPGTLPMQRIRLRKYLHIPTMTYILVPEMQIYGSNPSKPFLNSLLDWAVEAQKSELYKIKTDQLFANDFVLIGGSYSDTPTSELLSYFFVEPVELAPEYQNIEPSMDDPRVSEKLLEKDEFTKEMVRLAGVLDAEQAIEAASSIDIESKVNNNYINYNLRYHMEDIKINEEIIQIVKKDRGLMSNLAHKAMIEFLKQRMESSGVSYNVRLPIYEYYDRSIDLYIEILCKVPEDGNFNEQEVNSILKDAKFLGFLLRNKEEFQTNFNKKLKEKVNQHFNIKEQKARFFNYYLRG